MNRQIQELAAQAGYPDHMTYGQDKVLERFAELIIKESIEILQEQRDQSIELGWNVDESFACAIMHIEENFGICPQNY